MAPQGSRWTHQDLQNVNNLNHLNNLNPGGPGERFGQTKTEQKHLET